MYLFFDTETTGLSSADRIVQIAWILEDADGVVLSERTAIIQPTYDFSIPYRSTLVHGITTEQAFDEGEDVSLVLDEFCEDFEQAQFIVGHNVEFDKRFLVKEFDLIGRSLDFHQKQTVCTMKSSKDWCEIPKTNGHPGFKPPKLTELYEILFGDVFDGAHDALQDTRACQQCFHELASLGVIDVSV